MYTLRDVGHAWLLHDDGRIDIFKVKVGTHDLNRNDVLDHLISMYVSINTKVQLSVLSRNRIRVTLN